MINIEDIKVGKKYGFDFQIPYSHETHRDSLYEEGVVDSIDNNGETTFILYTKGDGKLYGFDFHKLLRLVGPFEES